MRYIGNDKVRVKKLLTLSEANQLDDIQSELIDVAMEFSTISAGKRVNDLATQVAGYVRSYASGLIPSVEPEADNPDDFGLTPLEHTKKLIGMILDLTPSADIDVADVEKIQASIRSLLERSAHLHFDRIKVVVVPEDLPAISWLRDMQPNTVADVANELEVLAREGRIAVAMKALGFPGNAPFGSLPTPPAGPFAPPSGVPTT